MLGQRPQSLIMVCVCLLSGLVGGFLAAFLFCYVVAQANPTDTPKTIDADIQQTITAQEFQLIDSRGRVRALLRFTENGQPFLQMTGAISTLPSTSNVPVMEQHG